MKAAPMNPRVVKVTVSEPKKVSSNAAKMAAFEDTVFDSATRFTCAASRGRGNRTTLEFTDFHCALAAVAADERAVCYAINSAGRAIILDRKDWPRWRARWDHNHQNQENTMTVADPTTSVFLLHWNGSGPTGCRVERFPDKLAADAYAFEVLPGDRTAHVVAEEGDLSERTIFNGPTLVAIFNAITNNDPGVKKFESLTYAKERVFRTLRDRFGAVPYTVIPTPTPEPAPAPVSGKPRKEPTVAKSDTPTTGRRGRPSAFADDMIITKLVDKNPKREGSAAFDRFALYRNGMKVKTFLEKGGSGADLTYDSAHEYISVTAKEAMADAA